MYICLKLEIMNDKLLECVELLMSWGLTPELIDIDMLESDYLFWLDVEMTCSFYMDKMRRY